MEILDLKQLWSNAIRDLLGKDIENDKLTILAQQTFDSIRRIEIYKTYRIKAITAAKNNLTFFHTSNPFILAQRPDLNAQSQLWVIYLATYFGKSNKSKWTLFNRASFDYNQSLITFDNIKTNPDEYFRYLSSFDFFDNCNYSNHRKFTAKKLTGSKGVFQSMEYVLDNIDSLLSETKWEFHEVYKLSMKIPNFGRLGSFDFSSSLVKCGFDIEEPRSMYAEHSTGPLQALELLLRLTNKSVTLHIKRKLSNDLVIWFKENSDIFMTGQVLEDAICNWQKNTTRYIRYIG